MTECQFLYLVNGEKQGEGFWRIGLTKNEDPLKEDKCFLECYRKELIGESAAKEILNAIEINLANLINDCISDGYFLETTNRRAKLLKQGLAKCAITKIKLSTLKKLF